jgi:hypothetical protein
MAAEHAHRAAAGQQPLAGMAAPAMTAQADPGMRPADTRRRSEAMVYRIVRDDGF